ncbi:MAG: hypothetical protein ACT4UP_00990 [Gammaproteobacteria bacterium]
MIGKFPYGGLPVSLLLVAAAIMQGAAIRAFADEGVKAEVVAGVEPEQRDCRAVERLGGKVKIRKAECRGRP